MSPAAVRSPWCWGALVNTDLGLRSHSYIGTEATTDTLTRTLFDASSFSASIKETTSAAPFVETVVFRQAINTSLCRSLFSNLQMNVSNHSGATRCMYGADWTSAEIKITLSLSRRDEEAPHDFMMRSVIGEYRKENSQLSTE